MNSKYLLGIFTTVLMLVALTINSESHAGETPDVSQLEKSHKQALESGDLVTAKKLESEILNACKGSVYETIFGDENIKLMNDVPDVHGDWLSTDKMIYEGPVGQTNSYDRQIDMKMSDDNIIFAAVNVGPTEYANGNVKVYYSSDYGKSWTRILNFSSFSYYSNISLLVESRSNVNPDSTRAIVFYTSSSSSNFDDSELRFVTMRRDGGSFQSGLIASPGAGNEFTSLSAVSDGAFYQGATYIGVVCSEISNNLATPQSLRYFRSINWGATWTGATLSTGSADFYPNATFKYNGDSIYIAVQRNISFQNSQVKVIATKFTPTAAFTTRSITTQSGVDYQKPIINIKQNNPTDSLMLTCIKNSNLVYYYSTNAGSTWSAENPLTTNAQVRSAFCSSTASGDNAFTVAWLDISTSNINMKKGRIGTLANYYEDINSYSSSSWVDLVCLTIPNSGNNFASVAYAGYGPQNLYFDIESSRTINLVIASEGLYNPLTNQHRMQDTVFAYLREIVSPYNIIDSAEAYIDRYTLNATLNFSRAPKENLYVEITTKNTIAVWYLWDNPQSDNLNLDLVRFPGYVLGNNEKRINSALNYYGLYTGDVNQDGIVDGTDTQLIDNDANAFVTGYSIQDLNGDNFVDGTDALLAGNNADNFVSVITP
jgi:hypothetical protein